MTGYTLAMLWKDMSGPVRRIVSGVRGHLRKDPQLGTLTRNVAARCWVATPTLAGRALDIVIDGDDEPIPVLLAHARDVLADFATLERRLEHYLEREAEEETDAELAAEIRALRLSSVNLRSPDRPGLVVIDFDGPDEIRFWSCEYVDGVMSELRFDS
jgi:hypothetical protein